MVNVYRVAGANPSTTRISAFAVGWLTRASRPVTSTVRPSETPIRYPMTGVSPVTFGGVHWRPTAPAVARALRPVGLSAAVPASGAGVTGADGNVGTLAPAAFTARTVTVYGVPLARPVSTA